MIKIKKGNIFTSDCQTLVNTINCVGVMGAGIAYEFRLRYPDMYKKYRELSNKKSLEIGKLWLYKSEEKWILNFPTKYHWKYPSKIEYLEKGLQKFLDTYESKGITSIAFPLLGASHGGIPENQSVQIMENYLGRCAVDVEIWHFDKYAQDDLYIKFKDLFMSLNEQDLSKKSGIRIDLISKIKTAFNREDVNNLSSLLLVKGVGDITLEKSFNFIMNYKNNSTIDLFSYQKQNT